MTYSGLYLGDSLEILGGFDSETVDSLITDPPAGIGFMGKEWDGDKGGRDLWIAWLATILKEALRVCKPGAHALVWALPRTSHWTMKALEDAGFEIRDVITHLFSQGMPKSMDIAKAIDKAERVKGSYGEVKSADHAAWIKRGEVISDGSNKGWERPWMSDPEAIENNARKYIPGSEIAKRWLGWGTALKPGAEYWILARKPISEKTLTANILKHEAGAINIEACRIGTSKNVPASPSRKKNGTSLSGSVDGSLRHETGLESGHNPNIGRWPSNVVVSHHDDCEEPRCHAECPRLMLDTQSGGGASRFYYCPKAPKKDKGEGNDHPTVKNTTLMDYLIRLITPAGGIVLDPFMGSGSTGVAAVRGGWIFVGIEISPEYFKIAQQRIDNEVP